MKSIYTIYERKLNSLLDNIDNTLDTGNEIASEIEDSMKEKFIKIVSFASGMSSNEEKIFRKLVTNTTMNGRNKYAICIIPRKAMMTLMKESGGKLKKTDFDVFPKDEKEFNVRTMIEFLSISQECGGDKKCKELMNKVKEEPDTFFNANYIKFIKLGTAVIIQDDSKMYLEINDTVSLVLKTMDDVSYNSKLARNFTYDA